jgi:hypothetical protein
MGHYACGNRKNDFFNNTIFDHVKKHGNLIKKLKNVDF